jgi:poly-gamma-glutamate synthesis protein (capsule biosynthesis protein)
MRIALTGDVMLGRLVDEYMICNPAVEPEALWGDILPAVLASELRMANLECVISTKGQPWRPDYKVFHFRAHPRAIEFLKAAEIDCVTLANNHILDYGAEALEECLELLDEAGIQHAGAGLDLTAALKPAVLQTSLGPVAVVAITDNEPAWEAKENSPGVNFAAYDVNGLHEPYKSRLKATMAAVRDRSALVIVSAHVGPNWGTPSPGMRALAHELISLGADLYWGHSNHTPQGIEVYQRRFILYSTGDFVDDYCADPVQRNDLSFLFVLEAGSGGIQRVLLHPSAIQGFRARLAQPGQVAFLQKRMQRLSAELGSHVQTKDSMCEIAV